LKKSDGNSDDALRNEVEMTETFEGNSDNLPQGPDSSGLFYNYRLSSNLKSHTQTLVELVLVLGLIFLIRVLPS
jgi:hypothetical protein